MAKISEYAYILKELRTNAGYTQTQIADMLNVHRTTYTKYEKDHTTGIDVLMRLAEIYNMTVDEMLAPAGKPETSYKVILSAPKKQDTTLMRLSESEVRLLNIFRESDCKKQIIDMARRLASESNNRK